MSIQRETQKRCVGEEIKLQVEDIVGEEWKSNG